MSVSCIIFLAVALVAGWVFLETREEITAVLSGSIAAICLIVSLILASWPIQVLVVFLSIGLSKLLGGDDPTHA